DIICLLLYMSANEPMYVTRATIYLIIYSMRIFLLNGKHTFVKTHSLKPLNLVLAAGLLSPVAAVADDFSLGVSAVYAPSPYRGDDDKVLPFPQINYDSQHVYVKGLSAGYYSVERRAEPVIGAGGLCALAFPVQ
ncbi:MAG: hypothetical protein ACR5LG_10240, partial [Sodalis sp. (in: enterobacteria)]